MQNNINFLDDERFYIVALVVAVVIIFFISSQKTDIAEVALEIYEDEAIILDGVLPDYRSSGAYEIIDMPENTEMIKERFNIGRSNPFEEASSQTSKKYNSQLP